MSQITMRPVTQETRRGAAGEELCAVIRELHHRGWCLGTSGNMSVVLDRDPLRLLLTSSGRDKGRMTPEHLLVVDAEGRPVEASSGRPSAETLLHCSLAAKAKAGAVLHTHSVPATLLGERFLPQGEVVIGGYEMLKGIRSVSTHEAEVRIPVVANSQDMTALSREVETLLERRGDVPAFLIAGHGLYVWGEDLPEATRHVEIFEFLFEVVARRASLAPGP